MNKKTNKGITLIALVITIIVLLILTGVSISILMGDNGILNKANEAKNATLITTEKEQIYLAILAIRTDKLNNGEVSNITKEELQVELTRQNANATTANLTEEGKIKVTFSNTKNIYIVDGDTGKIMEDGKTDIFQSELEKAKEAKTVFETKTQLEDELGNVIVVP